MLAESGMWMWMWMYLNEYMYIICVCVLCCVVLCCTNTYRGKPFDVSELLIFSRSIYIYPFASSFLYPIPHIDVRLIYVCLRVNKTGKLAHQSFSLSLFFFCFLVFLHYVLLLLHVDVVILANLWEPTHFIVGCFNFKWS